MGMAIQDEGKSIFKRKTLLLEERPSAREFAKQIETEECTVLVINSSQEMAKEITLQLTLHIPGCSIMYSPSIELAKWILRRRKIHLVVSSALLPDGSFTTLRSVLQEVKDPPDVVVVGDLKIHSAEIFGCAGYEIAALRRFGKTPITAKPAASKQLPLLKERIQSLGADIRNDLNNPLQEIVAMVFVAQAGAKGKGPRTANRDKALAAIDTAAKNMAKLVNDLESKILNAVKLS